MGVRPSIQTANTLLEIVTISFPVWLAATKYLADHLGTELEKRESGFMDYLGVFLYGLGISGSYSCLFGVLWISKNVLTEIGSQLNGAFTLLVVFVIFIGVIALGTIGDIVQRVSNRCMTAIILFSMIIGISPVFYLLYI